MTQQICFCNIIRGTIFVASTSCNILLCIPASEIFQWRPSGFLKQIRGSYASGSAPSILLTAYNSGGKAIPARRGRMQAVQRPQLALHAYVPPHTPCRLLRAESTFAVPLRSNRVISASNYRQRVGSGHSCRSSQDDGDRSSAPPQEAPTETPRLFSALNPSTLRHEPGSVFGAAALVSGTTVGAGILALPYATQVPEANCGSHV